MSVTLKKKSMRSKSRKSQRKSKKSKNGMKSKNVSKGRKSMRGGAAAAAPPLDDNRIARIARIKAMKGQVYTGNVTQPQMMPAQYFNMPAPSYPSKTDIVLVDKQKKMGPVLANVVAGHNQMALQQEQLKAFGAQPDPTALAGAYRAMGYAAQPAAQPAAKAPSKGDITAAEEKRIANLYSNKKPMIMTSTVGKSAPKPKPKPHTFTSTKAAKPP